MPTVAEASGIAGFDIALWQGFFAPRGTPPEIVVMLHKAIVQAMSLPDTKQRIEAMSVEPMATDPEAFGKFFHSELTRWTDVARRAGLSVQ